ncbi:hypothetical protein BDK51DRAFT_36729 [Blyttiomyces helicus]|uniref:PH domain-containing protein n=1 Tax=Blyttiomyces helicus TaxID=388810 RepID=A0A4P9WK81_9FUNG|nr:hypothetical protein BDK51DRAFT_36729 [Blyttiomyces helicus]|eukprot:RKO91560.1 hypothetical protein BDK51DRAFT_36729 [Blyttiomyces helicus]
MFTSTTARASFDGLDSLIDPSRPLSKQRRASCLSVASTRSRKQSLASWWGSVKAKLTMACELDDPDVQTSDGVPVYDLLRHYAPADGRTGDRSNPGGEQANIRQRKKQGLAWSNLPNAAERWNKSNHAGAPRKLSNRVPKFFPIGRLSPRPAPTMTACVLKQGPLSLRGSLGKSKRHVVLCAPVSVEDLHKVFQSMFKVDPSSAIDPKSVPFLGNIAYAAVRGTPLLVILPSEHKPDNPTFIHFTDVLALSDETQLSSACNFCVHLDVKPFDLRFSTGSSTEYQEWIRALREALEIAAASPHRKASSWSRGLLGGTAAPAAGGPRSPGSTARANSAPLSADAVGGLAFDWERPVVQRASAPLPARAAPNDRDDDDDTPLSSLRSPVDPPPASPQRRVTVPKQASFDPEFAVPVDPKFTRTYTLGSSGKSTIQRQHTAS